MAVRTLVILLAVQVSIGIGLVVWALAGFPLPGGSDGGAGDARAASAKVNRFHAQRALAFARYQAEVIGPRPAGSAASRRLARQLARRLPRGRLERVPGHPELRNVVGRIPGRRPAILVAAHYDTEARPEGHVGANDGAAGTAAVVEIARALRRRASTRRASAPRPREVRFVLFDGEEEPAGCVPFEACGLRGSKAYARRHAGEIGQMILLDYVGNRGLRLPREGTSDPRLWARLRAAARRTGHLRTFPPAVGASIIDDHTPFLERGVPAIDLIDWSYRYRDTLEDTPDKLSVRALDAVGETVTQLVLTLRRR